MPVYLQTIKKTVVIRAKTEVNVGWREIIIKMFTDEDNNLTQNNKKRLF